MPRGGPRPGAGRPRKAESEKAPKRKVAAKTAPGPGKGYAETGEKAADTPKDWPFGTQPPGSDQQTQQPAGEDGEPVIPGGAPDVFLQAVIDEPRLKLSVRMQAAAILAPFKLAKPAPVGKKEASRAAAREAGGGKFKPAAPPKLAAVGGKKV
jgi:phage terminase small subunit